MYSSSRIICWQQNMPSRTRNLPLHLQLSSRHRPIENSTRARTDAGDIAGAGLGQTGSALDILRESASQGALTHAVLGQQGLITEAGYEEQATSYKNMAQAAQVAIDAENKAATFADITGAIKGVAGIATLL